MYNYRNMSLEIEECSSIADLWIGAKFLNAYLAVLMLFLKSNLHSDQMLYKTALWISASSNTSDQ